MKYKKGKVYRTRLHFTKEEVSKAFLGLDYAGVNLSRQVEFDKSTEFQFGFFGGSSDSNKFYEGITAKDVIPKAEDFVDVPFRLLSATTVGAGSWKATDFSNAALLKGSMKGLLGKPIYYDHDTDLNNWVGIVKNVSWQEQYTDENGVVVPAGINGLLSIDAKTNPKMARGVLLGSIFSNSVTVEFDWTPSHNYSSGNEFDNNVGNTHSDGKMVRRIAVAIYDYHETSLVWLGADPFAKLIDGNGNLKNIDMNSVSYSKGGFKPAPETQVGYSEEAEAIRQEFENNKKYVINFASDVKSLLSLTRKENFKPQNKTEMNKHLLAFIAIFGTALGVSKAEDLNDTHEAAIAKLKAFTDEDQKKVGWFAKLQEKALAFLKGDSAETPVIADMDGFIAEHSFIKSADLVQIKADLAQLKADKAALTLAKETAENSIVEMKPVNAIGENFLKLQKAEAIRLYKVSMGEDGADAAVITLMENAKPNEVEGLLKQYTKGATVKFSGSCKACGSDEFQFKSSLNTGRGGNETTEDIGDVSAEAMISKFGASKMHN